MNSDLRGSKISETKTSETKTSATKTSVTKIGETVRACADSHAALIAGLAGLTDAQARQPSLLPDWSVGHVLTHIARNADGFSRMIEGARRGEIAAMYEHGIDGRRADIETGARRPVAELVADVEAACTRLDALFGQCDTTTWAGHGLTLGGETPISELPERRRGEVEIHRVDLGLGYTFADWPADYRRAELAKRTAQWASRKPMGFTDLPAPALALSPTDRLAWLLGRLEVEGLAPAGITG